MEKVVTIGMPMNREEYENLLNELNTPELEHSRRTEILQTLRGDYNSVIEEHEETTKKVQHLEKDNNDLILSNSKLFRQVGIQGDPTLEKKEEQKEFSETITLEQLEKQFQ